MGPVHLVVGKLEVQVWLLASASSIVDQASAAVLFNDYDAVVERFG